MGGSHHEESPLALRPIHPTPDFPPAWTTLAGQSSEPPADGSHAGWEGSKSRRPKQAVVLPELGQRSFS